MATGLVPESLRSLGRRGARRRCGARAAAARIVGARAASKPRSPRDLPLAFACARRGDARAAGGHDPLQRGKQRAQRSTRRGSRHRASSAVMRRKWRLSASIMPSRARSGIVSRGSQRPLSTTASSRFSSSSRKRRASVVLPLSATPRSQTTTTQSSSVMKCACRSSCNACSSSGASVATTSFVQKSRVSGRTSSAARTAASDGRSSGRGWSSAVQRCTRSGAFRVQRDTLQDAGVVSGRRRFARAALVG